MATSHHVSSSLLLFFDSQTRLTYFRVLLWQHFTSKYLFLLKLLLQEEQSETAVVYKHACVQVCYIMPDSLQPHEL